MDQNEIKGKIQLDEETIRLMQCYGSIVNSSSGKTYYFLPYWFECDTDSYESFIMHFLGSNLPKDLQESIDENRIIVTPGQKLYFNHDE